MTEQPTDMAKSEEMDEWKREVEQWIKERLTTEEEGIGQNRWVSLPRDPVNRAVRKAAQALQRDFKYQPAAGALPPELEDLDLEVGSVADAISEELPELLELLSLTAVYSMMAAAIEEEIRIPVFLLRRYDISWATIGRQLGNSKQAASKRFSEEGKLWQWLVHEAVNDIADRKGTSINRSGHVGNATE